LLRFAIHIVPQLPPQNGGVGDYATMVGRRMEEIGGVSCGYVAAGRNETGQPTDNARVRNVTGRCEPDALWRAVGELANRIEPSPSPFLRGRGSLAVVLHYSGYGYDRNGAPVWLVDALRETSRRGAAHVVSYFHELYATGQPWQRAFWYSARQRRVARDIARLSDAVITNREQSARWLEAQMGQPIGSVSNFAIPSNVGEPAEVPNYESRPPRAVTFGGERGKRFALCDDARRVARALNQLAIGELIDIGPEVPIDRRTFERAGIAVKQFGRLGAAAVSDHLRQCRVGFLDYPLTFIAKSSVFGGFSAHGVVPILRDPANDSGGGPLCGTPMPSLASVVARAPSLDDLQQVSQAVRQAYQKSNLECHARKLMELSGASIAGCATRPLT
jgi:hypothetical protein